MAQAERISLEMFDLSKQDSEKVDELALGAASNREAIQAVAEYLKRPPVQVAEYVMVLRTGRFDVIAD